MKDDTFDVEGHMEELRRKALDALGRYKFWMFGYYASQWVKINKVLGLKLRNPFIEFVKLAKKTKP